MIQSSRRPNTVVLADDDEDDRALLQRAWRECGVASSLTTVSDGVELLEYLRHGESDGVPSEPPRPGLILLDLNMPRMDGREVLRELKADPMLRRIPVVVLTTSKADEDIRCSYDLGAGSYISKPVGFDELSEAVRRLGEYWFDIVELPDR